MTGWSQARYGGQGQPWRDGTRRHADQAEAREEQQWDSSESPQLHSRPLHQNRNLNDNFVVTFQHENQNRMGYGEG